MPHAPHTGNGQPAQPLTTAIAVVLDETGSMQSCRDAAITGFNEWLVAQQRAGQPATLTLVLFSDRADAPVCRLRHDGIALADARPLDPTTYRPDGNTPLHDAVGRTIAAMDRLAPPPDRVLVVVLTDGLENASREYSQRQVLDLIRAREATGRWTFVYLGANQDAWAAGGQIGIAPGNTAAYDAGDLRGTFARLSSATLAYRGGPSRRAREFWGSEGPTREPAPPPPPAAPGPAAGGEASPGQA